MNKKMGMLPVIINVLFGIILAFLFCLLLNVLMVERLREDVSFFSETVKIWFYVYATMVIYILGYTISNILLCQQYNKKYVQNPYNNNYLKITLAVTILSFVVFLTPYILIKLL